MLNQCLIAKTLENDPKRDRPRSTARGFWAWPARITGREAASPFFASAAAGAATGRAIVVGTSSATLESDKSVEKRCGIIHCSGCISGIYSAALGSS